MKTLLLACIIATLTGCAGEKPLSTVTANYTPAVALDVPLQSRPDSVDVDIQTWAQVASHAVQARLYAPDTYAGKRCSVRMSMDKAARVLAATAEGGDPALCQAALAAIRQTNFPAFPSREVYQLLHNAPLDFAL